jgi:uncharacterized protein (TIGR02246 family)
MNLKLLCPLVLLAFCPGALFAQCAAPHADDEAAIRGIVADVSAAWARGDGRGFAQPFAENADYVVWNGTYIQGREAIARIHEQIFAGVYKNSELRLVVRSLRFLRDDVAAVHTEGGVYRKADNTLVSPEVVPLFILTKEKGKWEIGIFQNTKKESPAKAGQ